ncbi:hypothetical protein D7252_17000 [Microbacterium sp. CGR2]|nr:hypothetical protein D7252_17000 [Microbacterium sp. CGR2]
MTIDPSHFGPYLSLGLLVAGSANRSVATLLAEIRNAVFSGRPNSEQGEPRTVHAVEKFTNASVEGKGFVYRVRDTPSWWRGATISTPTGARHESPVLNDVLHLILVLKCARSIAVYTSHPSDWGRIVRAVEDGSVTKVKPMPADLINGAFTHSTWAMPTVWMKGLHYPVQTKADSKQLTGLNVRSVIDQFGDQTYHFSSGRSRVPLGVDDYESIGLSPSKHRIWLGQSADFADFCARTEWALKLLSGASAVAAPIAELAQPLGSLDKLGVPDEIGWAPQGERESWTSEAADAFALLERVSLDLDTTDSKIIEDDDTGDRTVHMVVHLVAQGAPITDVVLEIRYPQASNTVALRVVPAGQTDELDDYEQAIETILVEEGWGKIRYSDGHVVSGRVAYLPHYSAVPFTGWEWVDFTTPRAVDVTKEKPIRLGATDRRAADLSRIGEMGDDSLFSWAFDRWGEGRPGTLLCDDGSGEIADFLHLAPFDDDGESLLTFIHAKGGKSRGLRSWVVSERVRSGHRPGNQEPRLRRTGSDRGEAPGAVRECPSVERGQPWPRCLRLRGRTPRQGKEDQAPSRGAPPAHAKGPVRNRHRRCDSGPEGSTRAAQHPPCRGGGDMSERRRAILSRRRRPVKSESHHPHPSRKTSPHTLFALFSAGNQHSVGHR